MRIPRLPIAILTLAVLLPALPIQAQVIHTVAGGGPPDNIVATSASIAAESPAVDASGNVYFSSGEAVYKLDTTDHLTRIAGQTVAGIFPLGANGNACPTPASIGDGGPAAGAVLNTPMAVALDAAGNLYIADSFSCRVRVVNMQPSSITVLGVTIAPGNIGTVAGSSTFGSGGDGGPATNAQLYEPSGVAVDSSGNLYIADTGNSRVRKVNASGTITTIAGNGTRGCVGDGGAAASAELNAPAELAADAAGNIYIADNAGCNIRVVSTQAGTITVLGVTIGAGNIASVAGDGVNGYNGDGIAATSAELNFPRGVALDSFGNLYIADTVNSRIREVNTSGTIGTVAGNGTPGYSGDSGPAASAEIAAPFGVALDASGDLYIADSEAAAQGVTDYRIRKVSSGGTISTVAGNGNATYSGDGQTATGAQFYYPDDVAVDAAGNLYIADSSNNVIRAVNTQSSTITVLGISIPPGDIATVAGNESLHFSCSTDSIFCFGGDGGPATSALLNLPSGVALDGAGNLYIADSENARIRKVDTSGTISTVAGSDLIGDKNGSATGAAFNFPVALTLDWEGNIFVSDNYGNVIRAVNTQSYPITVLGVTIPPGNIATVAGNGMPGYSGDNGAATSAELSGPLGIALDAAGNLYFADGANDRARKVDTGGTITTVAGNGTEGYSGDGGAATSAELIGPYGVTADSSGNLYISDASGYTPSNDSAFRVVNNQACAIDVLGLTIAPGDIATVAGKGSEGFSGDGGLATGGMLDLPTGAALDAAGNLFIADELNLRIRRVDSPPNTEPDFTITTPTPTEQVSQAGDGITYMLTVSSVNGFSGAIAFSVNGNPAMGVSFPASVTLSPGGSQNIQVMLISAASLGFGNFPLNLIGTTECGVVHSLKLELVVANSAATTPTVTVTPSPASITTAQALSVTVTVSGTPSPTGTVTLTSGTYSSGTVTLTAGSTTINIPAGSLVKGSDTLTATYTPDSSSSSTYTSATGSNTVTVTAAATAPTVTVMSSPASITTAQALSVTVTVSGTPTPTGSVTLTSGSYSSGAVTLSGGSATINISAGTLATGTDTLTATYTPDTNSAATYNSGTGSNSVTVTAPAKTTPTITVTPSAPNITTAVGLGVAVFVSGSPSPTGSVVLTSGTFTSAAVTLSPGILSGNATISVPAGSLPAGTDMLTVTYTPDSNSSSTYNSATGTNTVSVTAASSGGGTAGWIWMNGSDMANQPPTYGTLGTAAIGNTPGGRHAASSWIDRNGNFWLLGGAGTLGGADAGVPGYLNDFWQFNPTANQWTWMGGSNNTGLDGQAGVYGTQGVPAAGNFPGSRFGAATWTDSKGNLWLFGGDAFDINGTQSGLNDLWEFNISTNEWTWIAGSDVFVGNGPNGVYGTLGVPAPGNIPGGRTFAMTWTDSKGNFWLFGGVGADSTFDDGAFGYLQDLWEFNPSTLEWTWMSGSTTSAANYGQPGVYGTLGTPSPANVPGARELGATWVDSSGNLWLFGGQGVFSLAQGASFGPVGDFNDLWEFTPSTLEWTWMGGNNPVNSQCNSSSCVGQPGTYGTLGTPAAANIPGGRHGASAWTDSSGNFWLFGGAGYDGGVTSSNFNDLWEFSASTNQWTWTGGSSTAGNANGQPGVYGVKGAPNPANIPGGRSQASSWVDKGGHFWLFGGSGSDCKNNTGDLNDLWEYQFGVSTSQGTGSSAGMITPTVIVSPSFSTITNTQGLTVTVTVSAGTCGSSPTPTGSVTLTSGSYTSAAVTLSGGTATISIPAGSLATGTDTLTATYTPDSNSSTTYNSATGTNTVMVSGPATTAPPVTVTPSPASITTTQALSVTVTVGGTPTPTGSVTLTSGTYSSGAVTLTSGNATINIPAGSLAKGTDTLSASYTPDFASSSTYTSATGSNTVTVTTPALITPTVTVSPTPSSITSAQALSATVTVSGGSGNPAPTGSVTLTSGTYSSGAVTLSSGSATINIPAGSLATSTDTLTATYTPDSASSTTYNSATGSNTVTVTAATFQVTVGTSPAGLSFSVDGTSYSATQSLTWTVGSSHTISTTSPQNMAGTQDTFAAWSDAGAISHSVTAPATARTYTASFTATAYQLTTAASPAADGTVTPASGTFYAPGTVVNLTATANTGFSFTNWTGNVASANSDATTITMSAPQSVTANFGAVVAAPVASLSALSPPTFTATVGTTSAAQSATLTNSGNAALDISGITITGTNPTDFAISTGSNACGTALAAGANCLIYVTFTPASVATISATLSVTDNAASSPQTVSLSGTGTPPPTFTLSSPTAPQTIQAGGAAQYTITAAAQNGTFSSAVTLAAIGLPTGAVATFSPASVTPGSSSANSTLSIQTASTTATAATRSATWPFATSALAVIGLCLVPGKRRRRWITMAVLLIASLGAFTALTACGGGFALVSPSQSYTITVTGTSGTDVQTTAVQLTVQ